MAVGPGKASDLKVEVVESEKLERAKYELKQLLIELATSNSEVYSIQYQVDNGKYSFAVIYGFTSA
jgi:hypothetical protein